MKKAVRYSLLAGLALLSSTGYSTEIYVTTTDGGIWQYDSVADMSAQTTASSSGTLIATHAAFGTDQGAAMDSSGSVYRVTSVGDVVQYPGLSDYLANSAGVTLASGVYTGDTGLNGFSYDGNTGGFYGVFAGASTTTPGDIVAWQNLSDFLANASVSISAAGYTGNILNFYDPDGFATTALGGASLNKAPGEAFTAYYFQVAGNGRLEGFESLADYAQNANNRGNITGTDVFGRNTTAFGTDVDAVGAFAVVPIPEPTSMVLLLLGTSLFVARRRL